MGANNSHLKFDSTADCIQQQGLKVATKQTKKKRAFPVFDFHSCSSRLVPQLSQIQDSKLIYRRTFAKKAAAASVSEKVEKLAEGSSKKEAPYKPIRRVVSST